MINKLLICLVLVTLLSCVKNEKFIAQDIINKSIKISGGDKIALATIDFDFRDIHYTAIRENGNFKLGRNFIIKHDTIEDWLSNTGFNRKINEAVIVVPDSMVPRYSASVNSVHYFSVLPFGLNDAAVNKELLGEVEVKGNSYFKIKVTFNEEGGGEDFEDIFMYFINKETFKLDFLAYSYAEDDGTGLRFREAYNERIIKGIRFVDYNNYKPKDEDVSLELIEQLFNADQLELLSKIELKKVKVHLN